MFVNGPTVIVEEEKFHIEGNQDFFNNASNIHELRQNQGDQSSPDAKMFSQSSSDLNSSPAKSEDDLGSELSGMSVEVPEEIEDAN